MGIFTLHRFQIQVNPPPAKNTQIAVGVSPLSLLHLGFNIPVEVTTASAFRRSPNPPPLKTIVVQGHFDTGASVTSIDNDVAQYLGLIPLGTVQNQTAGGITTMNTYAVDISFVNCPLQPFRDLRVGSCNLPFDFQRHASDPNDERNFGILIGRDLMSRWHITWDGPTSTVSICD